MFVHPKNKRSSTPEEEKEQDRDIFKRSEIEEKTQRGTKTIKMTKEETTEEHEQNPHQTIKNKTENDIIGNEKECN
jgi:hypothetical protein